MDWYKFFVWFLSPIRLFMRVKVVGRNNLPSDGAYIIAAGSHQTSIESILIPLCLRERQLNFFAKTELWKHRPIAWLMDATGQIPVQRGMIGGVNPSVDAGVKVLSSGGVIVVYPEGTFSRDDKVHRGHSGVARMALRTGVPIVPVGLVGMKRLNPSGFWMLPGNAEIHIGRPIYTDNFRVPRVLSVCATREAQVARPITDVTMRRIAHLSDMPYDETYSKVRDPK